MVGVFEKMETLGSLSAGCHESVLADAAVPPGTYLHAHTYNRHLMAVYTL